MNHKILGNYFGRSVLAVSSVVIALQFSPSSLFAAPPPVIIDENFTSLDLSEYVEYYVDKTNTLTIEDVEKIPDEQWKRPYKNRMAFGTSPYAHWFRFYLKKEKDLPEHIKLEVDYAKLDVVEFYRKHSDGSYEVDYQGSMQRKKIDKTRLLPAVNIIDNNKYNDIYFVKISCTSCSLLASMTLIEDSSHSIRNTYLNILFGLYYGFFVFILIYNMFLGISLKSELYFFYMLYHSAMMFVIFQSTGHVYLVFPDYLIKGWSKYSILFILLLDYFFVPFSNKMLQLADRWKFIRFFSYGYLLYCLIISAVYIYVDSSPQLIGNMNLMITFVHLLYMVLSGVLLIQRQRSAWYYFPALFFVNIAVLFRVTSYNGLIPVNLQWSLIPGSAIEALLMSFALADRFKVMRDEKEKAQAEAIVHKEQAIENLKKSDEIKNRFLANTSHELRTPLHGIIGLTRHMITHGVKNMEPEEKRTLELVLASAIRLSELINDILDYSSMVRGAVSFAKKPFNLARVAAESVSLLNELAEDKNIRIVNKLEGAELPYLNGDEKRVAQIFSNLLGNAIKYNSNCIVVVDAIPGNHYVNIKVSDDGNGMDEKQMETVFEPFQTSAGSSAKGVGLGLSIVRELVESHGGQIDVESRKNNGTTFSFTLPVFKVSDSEKYLATKAPAVEIIPERNITILAIDDEPINLEVYKHQLSKKYNTLTTLSAKDTEEILSDHTIDLILLDIMMPGIDGFELLNKIRKRFNSEDLPVIIVSARDQNHDLIEGLNRGANDYLVKPYDVEQLLRRIDNQLKMKETLENRNTELEKQRTDIYADLHDHLGSQMTDMKIIFNNIMEKKAIDPAFAFELRESMDRAVDTLRERIFHLEDIANFEEDFLGNLHAIFLRRYASAGRQLAFEYNEKVNQSLVSIARPQIRETLYTVTREIVTNDLKYGKGKSQWNYVHDNENILIIFEAGTVYELGRNKTGNGTHNIQRRLAEIGAVVKFGIEGDVFHMEICIPLVVND